MQKTFTIFTIIFLFLSAYSFSQNVQNMTIGTNCQDTLINISKRANSVQVNSFEDIIIRLIEYETSENYYISSVRELRQNENHLIDKRGYYDVLIKSCDSTTHKIYSVDAGDGLEVDFGENNYVDIDGTIADSIEYDLVDISIYTNFQKEVYPALIQNKEHLLLLLQSLNVSNYELVGFFDTSNRYIGTDLMNMSFTGIILMQYRDIDNPNDLTNTHTKRIFVNLY